MTKKYVSKVLVAVLVIIQIVVSTSFAKNKNTESIVVDRIIGKIAVCENSDGEVINIKVSKFKTKPKHGKIYKKSSIGKYVLDKAETQKIDMTIREKFFKLFN